MWHLGSKTDDSTVMWIVAHSKYKKEWISKCYFIKLLTEYKVMLEDILLTRSFVIFQSFDEMNLADSSVILPQKCSLQPGNLSTQLCSQWTD